MSQPKSLFGLPGAECLYPDVASVWEVEIEGWCEDRDGAFDFGSEVVIEEWSVRNPLEALPDADDLILWIQDEASDCGEWTEDPWGNNSLTGDREVVEAAKNLMALLAAKVTYHMADEKIREHRLVIPRQGGVPLVGGVALYSPEADHLSG